MARVAALSIVLVLAGALLAGCNEPQKVLPTATGSTTPAPTTTARQPPSGPRIPPDCEVAATDIPAHSRENVPFNVTLDYTCHSTVKQQAPKVRVLPVRNDGSLMPDISDSCRSTAVLGPGRLNFTCVLSDPGTYQVTGVVTAIETGQNATTFTGQAFITQTLPATAPPPLANRPRLLLYDVPFSYRAGEPITLVARTRNVLFSPAINHSLTLWMGQDSLIPQNTTGCVQQRLQPSNLLTCPVPAGTSHVRALMHLQSGGNGTRYWSDVITIEPSTDPEPVDCETSTSRLPATQRARAGFDFRVHFTCDRMSEVLNWTTSVRVVARPQGGEPIDATQQCQPIAREVAERAVRWNCNLSLVAVDEVRPVLRAATLHGPLVVAGPARVVVVTRSDLPVLPTTQPAVQLFDVLASYKAGQPFAFMGSVNWRTSLPPENYTLGAQLSTGLGTPATPTACGPEASNPAGVVRLECTQARKETYLRAYVRAPTGNGTMTYWSDPAPIRPA